MALAICPKCGAMTQGGPCACSPVNAKTVGVLKPVHKPVHTVHKPGPVNNPVNSRGDTVIRELAAHGITLDALEALARGEFALIPTATVAKLEVKAGEAGKDRKTYRREWTRKRRAAEKSGHATDTAVASPSSPRANGELSS